MGSKSEIPGITKSDFWFSVWKGSSWWFQIYLFWWNRYSDPKKLYNHYNKFICFFGEVLYEIPDGIWVKSLIFWIFSEYWTWTGGRDSNPVSRALIRVQRWKMTWIFERKLQITSNASLRCLRVSPNFNPQHAASKFSGGLSQFSKSSCQKSSCCPSGNETWFDGKSSSSMMTSQLF